MRDLKRVGSAHAVGARSFTQPLAPEMVGYPIVASWSVDLGGLRLASNERLAKTRRSVCAMGWRTCFSAIGTKDAQGGFNHTRRGVRWALSGTMQPVSQWHNLACSNVSEEAGGKAVLVEPQDRCVHKGAFRKSSFQKKTPPTSGRVASENGRPRRTGTRIRPQTSASWSNSNRTQ